MIPHKSIIAITLLLELSLPLSIQSQQSAPTRSSEGVNPHAFILNQEQEATLSSIQDLDSGRLYQMTYSADYMLDTLLEKGCKSNDELIGFLMSRLLRPFPMSLQTGAHCSAFMARTPEGEILMGRNFDYNFPSSADILTWVPKSGDTYRSMSMVSMPFLNDSIWVEGCLTDGRTDISAALGSVFMPLDGMNSEGLAIGVLQVPGTGTRQSASGKKDIVTTLAIRYVLDRAASVEQALRLLEERNMFAGTDARSSYHFFLADRSGRCAVLEYVPQDGTDSFRMSTLEEDHVTNFYLTPGFQDQGGGRERYELLTERLSSSGGILTEEEAMNLLRAVSQEPKEGQKTSRTQWSAVYNLSRATALIAISRNYDRILRFSLQ